MIAVLKHGTTETQTQHLIDWLKRMHVDVHVSHGKEVTVLGLVGDTSRVDMDLLKSLEMVETVKRVSEPYKQANRKFHPKDTVVEVGTAKIGGGHFAMIAGPCSVESEEQIIEVAEAVKSGGADLLRGGAFKPRTSPYAFQGMKGEGIRLLLPVFRMMAENGCDNLDYDTREKLYCASIYGGLAINVTGTCFPHTMGYLLTETFRIPHGTACAVFQKDFYEYNKAVVPALAAEFLERIGCSEEEYFSLIGKLTPPCEITMREVFIAESHSRWINNGSLAKCQGVFSADMADDILRRKFLAE